MLTAQASAAWEQAGGSTAKTLHTLRRLRLQLLTGVGRAGASRAAVVVVDMVVDVPGGLARHEGGLVVVVAASSAGVRSVAAERRGSGERALAPGQGGSVAVRGAGARGRLAAGSLEDAGQVLVQDGLRVLVTGGGGG